ARSARPGGASWAVRAGPDRGAGRAGAEPPVKRVTAFFFLATLACVSFEKIQWQLAGTVGLAGVLGALFVVCFGLERLGQTARRFPQPGASRLRVGVFVP